MQTHGASNRNIHLYPPHNIPSIHLTKTKYVRRIGPITNGKRSGRTTPQDSAFTSPTPAPIPPEWPSQEEPGSGLTASAQVLDVSAPACTNGVWSLLRPVSVAQKNKLSTMLSSNVQSIVLCMTAWPDCSGRWDSWMAAQHLPRDLMCPSSGSNNWLKRWRIHEKPTTIEQLLANYKHLALTNTREHLKVLVGSLRPLCTLW